MKPKAIALCRVSTARQRIEGHSLEQQEQSVKVAEQELGVTIVRTWSLDTSSKAGMNIKRKDLEEIRQFCKTTKGVKYFFVDRVSRLMREAERFIWFIVELRDQGVETYFTAPDQRHLNNPNDRWATLAKFFTAVQAQQENDEKALQNKQKMQARVTAGYYPFNVKYGYEPTDIPGLHKPSELIKAALILIKDKILDGLPVSAALREFNANIPESSQLRIDKFKRVLADEYYAGLIVVKNWTEGTIGLHEALWTLDEARALKDIVEDRRPYQRKIDNPEFPVSNLLLHDCKEDAKFTGSFQGNGHGSKYPKYRCRKCGKQYHRNKVHNSLTAALEQFDYSGEQQKEFIEALSAVWRQQQQHNLELVKGFHARLEKLQVLKSELIRELANAHSSLKVDIQTEIGKVKDEIATIESEVAKTNELRQDLVEFVKFGLEYTNILKEDWWLLSKRDRLECQQLIFPAGIRLDSSEKVSTTEISPLYRLAATKKNLDFDQDSLLVELRGIAPRSARLHSTRSTGLVCLQVLARRL